MISTTKEQFEYFVKMCKKYIDYFGLYEWDIEYTHEKLEVGTIAQIRPQMPAMQATIAFNTERQDCDGKMTHEEIRMTAAHETTHLLTAKLRASGATRYLNPDEIYQHDEEIANRMVRFFRKIKCI